MQLLVRNYDSVDADQQHGGTQLQDIITYAYNNNHFKNGAVSFEGLLRPHRFLDNAKFKHCLDLCDVVATEEQFTTLKTAGLDATVVENLANTIKDSCLAQLVLWEALKKPKKAGPGYTGVGTRVQAIKKQHGDLREIGSARKITSFPQKPRPDFHRLGSNNSK